MPKNVTHESMQFADESVYRGQVLEGRNYDNTPHGYGKMVTKEGFEMLGYFKDGKAQGPGRFTAPNGDVFFGVWDAGHKRHGRGCSIRAKDGLQLIEKYEHGKLLKKLKRRVPKLGGSQVHWDANRLQTQGQAPCARAGHTVTYVADSAMVILFGGQTQDEEGRPMSLNDMYILDCETLQWSQPPAQGEQPPPMHGHTATAVGDEIFIIGGQDGIEVSSSVYVFNTRSGVWSRPITKGINFVNHTASLVGNRIIVIVQASVFALHLDSMSWEELDVDQRPLKMFPKSVIGQSAVAVNNTIVVFGGKILGGAHRGKGKSYVRCTAGVRLLHIDRLAWEIPQVAGPARKAAAGAAGDYSGMELARGGWECPRSEHTATLVGNKMYVIGGWTSASPDMNVVDTSYLNDVQVLDFETMEFTSPPVRDVKTIPRGMHSTVKVRDELWVFGGSNYGIDFMSEFDVLHPALSEPAPRKAPADERRAAAPAPAATAAPAALPGGPDSGEDLMSMFAKMNGL